MNLKNLVDCNISRISKLVDFHKKELADVSQKLRIIQKSREDKITLLNIEHNKWMKEKENEIARLQKLVADKSEFHQKQREEIIQEFAQQEESFIVRKEATKAFIKEATKSDCIEEEHVYYSDPTSRALAIMASNEDWTNAA